MTNYKKIIGALSVIVLSLVIITTACRHKPVIPDLPAISFGKDVQPIITANCALSGCHEAYTQKSLADYNDVMRYITPGDAPKSQLYKSIISLGGIGTKPMPPSQPLSEEQLKLIYVWIMQGAKRN